MLCVNDMIVTFRGNSIQKIFSQRYNPTKFFLYLFTEVSSYCIEFDLGLLLLVVRHFLDSYKRNKLSTNRIFYFINPPGMEKDIYIEKL